jgi:hypothetical protein
MPSMSEQMDSGMLRDAFSAFPTGMVALAAQVAGRLVGRGIPRHLQFPGAPVVRETWL